MKITNIETIVVRTPYTCGGPYPMFGGKEWSTADTLLVRVDTDRGITGWGEAFGYNVIPGTKAVIDQMLKPVVVGREANSIASLMFDLQQKLHVFGRTGPTIYALSGLDIALWDIAGKAAGVPLSSLLGGTLREELTAYASLMRYSDPDVVARNTTEAVRRGYGYVKLHEITRDAVYASRAAAGDDIEIMIDTNCPWSELDALAMARQFAGMNPYWLEEPIWPPENFAGLAAVGRASGITIAAGENAISVMDFKHMFQAGAVSIAQPSVTKIGGVSELVKVMHLAASHNVTVIPHSPYFGPGFLATAHVLATLPGPGLIEWLYFDLEESMYGDAIIPVQGKVKVPQGAGLGFDPNPAVVERYRVG